jgi:Bacterial regulatory proteins, tetR family
MGFTVNPAGKETSMAGQQAGDAGSRSLWFNPPDDGESSRRLLTRERVVAEALAVISAKGAQALSMRAIAARLGVVPGALYSHVRGSSFPRIDSYRGLGDGPRASRMVVATMSTP